MHFTKSTLVVISLALGSKKMVEAKVHGKAA